MSCEGKNLYELTREQLEDAALSHFNDSLMRGFNPLVDDNTAIADATEPIHRMHEIADVYEERFGGEQSWDLYHILMERIQAETNLHE